MEIAYKLIRFVVVLPIMIFGLPFLFIWSDNLEQFKDNLKDMLWS